MGCPIVVNTKRSEVKRIAGTKFEYCNKDDGLKYFVTHYKKVY